MERHMQDRASSRFVVSLGLACCAFGLWSGAARAQEAHSIDPLSGRAHGRVSGRVRACSAEVVPAHDAYAPEVLYARGADEVPPREEPEGGAGDGAAAQGGAAVADEASAGP
ncbi:MAG: hypothetical protein ACK57N_00585, partial [Planctomycetia bacterium]